jgi:hypothetical protein
VVDLWLSCRSEMGPAQLPFAGGRAEQPAWLMQAFGICAQAFHLLTRKSSDA